MSRLLLPPAFLVLLLAGIVAGAPGGTGAGPGVAPALASAMEGGLADTVELLRVHERTLALVGSRDDTAIVSAWHFETLESGDGTEERRRLVVEAWEGSWGPVDADTSRIAATRAPWRILPSRPFRLVVGLEDRLELLRLDGPLPTPRDGPLDALELAPGSPTHEWASPDGTLLRVQPGERTARRGEEATAARGPLVEVIRSWRPDPGQPAGGQALDWVVLLAGGEPVLFLEELPPLGTELSRPGRHRGWSALRDPDSLWPVVEMAWPEVGAFERARRDIPATWSASAPGPDGFEAQWSVTGSWLEAGEGEGPLLPVRAFFEVEGFVRFGDDSVGVRGLVRHSQP